MPVKYKHLETLGGEVGVGGSGQAQPPSELGSYGQVQRRIGHVALLVETAWCRVIFDSPQTKLQAGVTIKRQK